MRQVSQPLCLRGESGSLPLRSATGCRPWWPSGFQIRRMRFDSSASCRWCTSDRVASAPPNWACAEGGAPALQAGFLGALPSRSTERSAAAELRRGAPAHAARWPCTSLVSRRIRFDSERGLCVYFHCPRSTVAVHLARNEAGSVRFRTWAPVVPKAPALCSGVTRDDHLRVFL